MFTMRFYQINIIIFCVCFFINSLYAMNFSGKIYRGLERITAFVTVPTHTPVFMNHADSIVLPHNELLSKTISTRGLRGCMVMVLYMKNAEEQRVFMTHFHPDLLNEHSAALRQGILSISEKYDYAHSIFIYQNGWSCFTKNRDEINEYKNNNEVQEVLRKRLAFARETEQALQLVVTNELKVPTLDMSRMPYALAPARPRGACTVITGGEPAEVAVTLSNDPKNHSLCQLYDAFGRKMYGENKYNKEVMFSRSKEEQNAVTILCAPENE